MPASTNTRGSSLPSDAELARASAVTLRRLLKQHEGNAEPVEVLVDDDTKVVVPRAALELLTEVLGYISAGRAFSVVPSHAELTTQQAAEMLNVSRPFLVGLLERGEIEFRKVGTHRRVLASSLLGYRTRDDAQRRESADALSRETQELEG